MNERIKVFLRDFSKHYLGMTGVVVLLIEILVITFLPVILKLDPYSISKGGFNLAPSAEYWFGTDALGRDLFARVLYGGRTSLLVGFLSTFLSILIGLPMGLIAGYYRGIAEQFIMRLADIFMSVPSMILILTVVAVFEPSLITIIMCIGVTGWPGIAKLIYGNVLSVSRQEYVEAARAIGTKNGTILRKYILPNSITPLWMCLAFRISSAILTESGLSFLGAGIQAPQASWGNILYEAQNITVLTKRWWIWAPAGLFLMLTIICINLIGEAIRDILDPKTVSGR